MLSLNIIGAGRCGKTLGLLLKNTQKVHVQAVCNFHEESALEATQFIGEGIVVKHIKDLPSSDLTMMTCPDDDIKLLAMELSLSQNLNSSSTVFHCSGTHSSDILKSLRKKGCLIASIHPLMSFSGKLPSLSAFSGCYCGVEGDESACQILSSLFFEMGAHVFEISSEHKKLYHAGAVVASNYLVTLAKTAQSLMMASGIEEDVAKNMICSLMGYSLENLANHDKIDLALTGPIKRGDLKTLSAHMDILPNEAILNIYRHLGLETIKMTALSEEKKHQIIKILKQME